MEEYSNLIITTWVLGAPKVEYPEKEAEAPKKEVPEPQELNND